MSRAITRRDFLNGAAIGIGSAFAGAWLGDPSSWGGTVLAAPPYPPALTGLRGSHEGSFEVFHALRDGSLWRTMGSPTATREHYDLVVVGGGISGLAAAYYFRKARPDARILVLDNHDDFGGHAKRNEFAHGGRTRIGYGGTQSIDSPAPYSAVAKGLIEELGIDVSRYPRMLESSLYTSLGLRPGFFFDRETFGKDMVVPGNFDRLDEGLLAAAPLTDAVKRDLRRLFTEAFDPLAGLASTEKRARLARTSYANFLTKMWRLDPGVLPLFQVAPHGLFGVGIDAVSAQDGFGLGFPGFQAMALDAAPGPGQNYDAIRSPEAARYYFHFPDGNATVARLLVRRLIPGAIPGSTSDDIVTARADYAKLDVDGLPVRVRLNSPVVRVSHQGQAQTGPVEVVYAGRDLRSVTADHVVLACWHTAIPLLCPELPEKQKEALAFAIKVPLVYTNVFVRSWTSFQKLGVSSVEAPGLWHTELRLDSPVSIGDYHHTKDPAEPIVLHMSKSACQPGLPVRDQHRAGRMELFATSFEQIERSIRNQLARVLGPGGFDPARDILGITVNRWPHGYAYQYNSLFDDFWVNGGEQPCVVARKRYGRITIANADAGAYSYTDAAIDHGYRAIRELLGG